MKIRVLAPYDPDLKELKLRPFPHFLLFDLREHSHIGLSELCFPIATASGKNNVDDFLHQVITPCTLLRKSLGRG